MIICKLLLFEDNHIHDCIVLYCCDFASHFGARSPIIIFRFMNARALNAEFRNAIRIVQFFQAFLPSFGLPIGCRAYLFINSLALHCN